MAVNLLSRNRGLVHLQAVGGQGGPGVVTQLRAGAVKPAADAGTEQADRATPGMADNSCPGQVEQTAGEMFCI